MAMLKPSEQESKSSSLPLELRTNFESTAIAFEKHSLSTERPRVQRPNGHPNHNLSMGKTVILQTGLQTRVTVSTPQASLLQIEPYRMIYKIRQCPASYEIAQAQLVNVFNFTISNFGDKPNPLLKGQRVATTDSHPSGLTETHISQAGIFGIEENDRHTYRKRIFSACDTVLSDK